MQLPESIAEAKAWTIVLGAMGAVMSLAFIKDMPWQQKLSMMVVGTVISAIFAQPVIDLVNMPKNWSDGIAFLTGMFGWSLAGALLTMVRKSDMWGLASDVLRSWLSKGGS